MSLFAASTASRHLRRHLTSAASNAASPSHLRIGGGNVSSAAAAATRRHLSSSKGGTNGAGPPGLRRPRNGGRPAPVIPKSSQQAAAVADAASKPSPPSSKSSAAAKTLAMDPHTIADKMVNSATTIGIASRTPGTESVATLTREQRMSNFAMAAGLLGFVSYIFYYSLASVGGADAAKALLFGTELEAQKGEDGGEGAPANPGFEEFLREASEGRSAEEEQQRAESEARGEARELAELESSTSARLKAEGVGEEVMVGLESEEEEREMARAAFEEGAAAGGEKTRRPLWKRVVFFWRRE